MTTLLEDLQDLVSQFEREKITEEEVINIISNITKYYYKVDLDNLHYSIIGVYADYDEGNTKRSVANELVKNVIFDNLEYEIGESNE
mgnify:FL=1